MNQELLRSLVWTDYRLALLLTVLLPLILLIWALMRNIESIQRLSIIYWRVASLLLITVYLMIPSWPISFLTGLAARILIPICLWFWVDLNDEIKDLPQSSLKLVFTSWRWAITLYSSFGAIAYIPFLSCAFGAGALKTSFCQVWLEAPWSYKALFHSKATEDVLGFFGMMGLSIYVLYLAYFVFIRLGKQGRTALDQ
jgi:hypothetical protein